MDSNRNGWLFTTALRIILATSTVAAFNTTDRRRPNIEVKITKVPPSVYFLKGENFTLNCSVDYMPNDPIALVWTLPRKPKETDVHDTNEKNMSAVLQYYYNAITITNAEKDDEGNYTCAVRVPSKNTPPKTVKKKFLDRAFLSLTISVPSVVVPADVNTVRLRVSVKSYPQLTLSDLKFFRDNQTLVVDKKKYNAVLEHLTGDITLEIFNLSVNDTGNYTVQASNGHFTKSVTIDLKKKAHPAVFDFGTNDKICPYNSQVSLSCKANGYPLPNIEWIFTTTRYGSTTKRGVDVKLSEYEVESTLTFTATLAGNITCKAGDGPEASATRKILIHDIEGGFGIENSPSWFSEHEKVTLKCLASIYEYRNVTWRERNDNDITENVIYYDSPFSHVAKLNIKRISLNHTGKYTCVGQKFNGSEKHQSKYIVVEATRPPVVIKPDIDNEYIVVELGRQVQFSCLADAVPPPAISWLKDGIELENNTNGLTILSYLNQTVTNSTIVIAPMVEGNEGKYECLASSGLETDSRFVNITRKGAFPHTTKLLAAIGAIILALIVLVIYLTWKIRKEKRFRKELAAAGLLYFKEGVTSSLNPDLGIDEQAELLPYDEKFEFPPEKLILGKQLGAGAFGVVYKAEARGIINAEETTPVAVKMVKKTADNMFIKALASELKIMVHMGKHINIVNLLGACTKNVGKRELIVIVEYCKFGNIHNYMQKHREVFIDQLTDNKEKNLGRVNRGYSCSSGSSGMNSDYFGMNHTQATDQTILNSANTNRSARKVSETGYIQPEWRSNYESDYSFDGRNPRPLTSRDLLAWAFQIARGMEYLASRKVLHGDLAARNVLLAEDNIVKICDFGLARSIYKNDEYQKKENSPLPVKWLAIECMMDRIFSTQSDVWSFGIVLWEMFSLAKTPYPNMSPQSLLQWLSDGHRLEKPPYADDRLYDVMMRCWEHKPTARPSFTQLQELLGSFLEDNVRNHYVDLNSSYMDTNVKTDGQDYLQMVCAPDYNNLVTPSPHHYMNDSRSFFPPTPTQVPLDDEGYLQMTPAHPSIFSPRNLTTKFDFDAKKFDSRLSEGNGGSELTPMLTLSNLPARSGSESDHESHSPYLKMCPRISEESDDVFKPNLNNIKNNIQNSAVTNPTYITSLDMDLEKKPQNINTYINIPNGLVK
ncbi:hypothetical protein ABMA28_016304 [Loxostege sticticalis]|uniref:receptor protein-tyrosine kinase n=1 Tax=Loxostege sticticalis TaxID=481309 RepID=A0ABD0T8D8_LOXSC